MADLIHPGRRARSLGALIVFATALLFVTTGCPHTAEPNETATDKPTREIIKVPGIDTSALTPREKREWSAQLREVIAPCKDTPVTLAECIQEKRDCSACLPAAEYLRKQVQAGRPKKARADAYTKRFDSKEVKTIDVEGSPTKGPKDALVTIVEWADFECRACKGISPILDAMVHRFDGQVRLVYKFYPLKSHPNGEIAARSGIAAQNQKKFWPMHDAMFDNQGRLARSDLEKLARGLDLDLKQFKKDLTEDVTAERIAKDMKQGESLGLEGTPLVFVNGRELDMSQISEQVDVEDWISLDIRLLGKEPAKKPSKETAPAGSASAGPAASASAGPAPSAGAAPGEKPKK